MKILILGASGNVGRRVIAECLRRDHEVTAVGRDSSRLQQLPKLVKTCTGDIADPATVAGLAAGQEVVINATRPPAGREADVKANTRGLLQGLAGTGTRLLVVGGAASLVVPDTGGVTVINDSRYLNPALRHIGQASLDQYLLCLEQRQLNWTYLSPPADLFPGKRTGIFRCGRDELVLDADGHSRISMEDLAVALLDEVERPRHHRRRFTVAY